MFKKNTELKNKKRSKSVEENKNDKSKLIKEEDLSLMKFDKYILKTEFLLAWHFENNFFPKQLDQIMGIDYYSNLLFSSP